MISLWPLLFLEGPWNPRPQVILLYMVPYYKDLSQIIKVLSWMLHIIAAVPEWFAAASFGLVALFTLFLRNVPALQSNLL